MNAAADKGLFIAATGTDAGKTVLAAALARHAAARWPDLRIAALKPVASGFDPADQAGSDAGRLLGALGRPVDAAGLDQVNPWRFADPISPDLAARRSGRLLGFEEVAAFCRRARDTHDKVIVESAGGVMSPLTQHHTMRDLAVALGLPVVLLSGAYLGAISHILTALEALRARGLDAHALVLNIGGDMPVDRAEIADSLARFAPGLPLFMLPRLAAPFGAAPALDALAARIWDSVAAR